MASEFITTVTGQRFYFNNPQPDQINLTDIAYALANTKRWGGHAYPAISVAQHSVMVAERLQRCGATPMVQLQGLFHDAAEAYLGDIPTPIKAIMPQYQALEMLVEDAIFKAFNIVYPMDPHVHLVDVEVRNWEYRDRMKTGTDLPLPVGNPSIIPVVSDELAEEMFVERYFDLASSLDILKVA